MQNKATTFIAPQAWVHGEWANDVLLSVGEDGSWNRITPNAGTDLQAGAVRLKAPVLPGLVNAHSHAFQRAIAGLTERRNTDAHVDDDFWSWRDRMYSVANRITPEQLETIAAQLYTELLAGGFTHVCEFHYLHNALDGQAYANPAEMSLALVRAAQRTGIGLTLLPTLYMRSGFNATGLREDQRRFASNPEQIIRFIEEVQRHTTHDPFIQVGVAIHSLRAVSPPALADIASYAKQAGLPVHIHIAEQMQEVDDCRAHTGQRPIEWLLDNVDVDERWNLVHATHATSTELIDVQRANAAIVICPTTEANLGDGVFDLPSYAAAGGRWSLGTDSHITRNWSEELRLLEYSQRLALRRRNVSARALNHESTATALFEGALAGGTQASGQNLGCIAVGQRADFVTLDINSSALLGIPNGYVLDAYIFSSPAAPAGQVFVAGVEAHTDGTIDSSYAKVMQTLW
jgi:formimidoylglutamate deiminase